MSPCGFCRQFLVEFGKDLVVLMEGGKEMVLSELLPMSFGREDMDA